jgi:hypothetical protein
MLIYVRMRAWDKTTAVVALFVATGILPGLWIGSIWYGLISPPATIESIIPFGMTFVAMFVLITSVLSIRTGRRKFLLASLMGMLCIASSAVFAWDFVRFAAFMECRIAENVIQVLVVTPFCPRDYI